MTGAPRSERFDDVYFSPRDGLAETRYVYLEGNNLPQAFQGRPHFCIGETGFGTGLNFLATWTLFDQTANPGQNLTYIAFEKYPLTPADIEQALTRWAGEFGHRLNALVKHYPLRVHGFQRVQIAPNVTLILVFDDVNRALPELQASVDAWFLDGFAPKKNPDMWTDTVLSAIAACSHNGTTLASFTAAGFVRRALAAKGFHVKRRNGFGYKYHMTTAVFNGVPVAEVTPPKSIAIIGAGLAGTAMAHALKQYGIPAVIYERTAIASGASGNSRGLFNPRFTQKMGFETDFYGAGYALAHRLFSGMDTIDYAATGSVHVFTDAEKQKRLEAMCHNWNWHEDHVRIVSAEEARDISGAPLQAGGLYLPDSGSVNPSRVCAALAEGTELRQGTYVQAITQYEHGWHVNGTVYDAVVLCCADAVTTFEQTQFLPIGTVRGQVIAAAATPETAQMKTNICYGGYVSPGIQGQHVIGSTFQPWLKDTTIRDEDSQDILQKFATILPSWARKLQVSGARASLRAAAKDRVPIGGAVPGHPGLYVSVAHGSHGLISALIIAEGLAAQLAGRPVPLPLSTTRYMAPDRFRERV